MQLHYDLLSLIVGYAASKVAEHVASADPNKNESQTVFQCSLNASHRNDTWVLCKELVIRDEQFHNQIYEVSGEVGRAETLSLERTRDAPTQSLEVFATKRMLCVGGRVSS